MTTTLAAVALGSSTTAAGLIGLFVSALLRGGDRHARGGACPHLEPGCPAARWVRLAGDLYGWTGGPGGGLAGRARARRARGRAAGRRVPGPLGLDLPGADRPVAGGATGGQFAPPAGARGGGGDRDRADFVGRAHRPRHPHWLLRGRAAVRADRRSAGAHAGREPGAAAAGRAVRRLRGAVARSRHGGRVDRGALVGARARMPDRTAGAGRRLGAAVDGRLRYGRAGSRRRARPEAAVPPESSPHPG